MDLIVFSMEMEYQIMSCPIFVNACSLEKEMKFTKLNLLVFMEKLIVHYQNLASLQYILGTEIQMLDGKLFIISLETFKIFKNIMNCNNLALLFKFEKFINIILIIDKNIYKI